MNIVRAQRADKARIVKVLCESFPNDPQTNYILGSAGNRATKLKRLMAYAFEYGMVKGNVEISDDGNAAAIWKNRHSGTMSVHLLVESILFLLTYGPSGLQRISAMEKRIAAFYPDNVSFNYLWILGTDPQQQGKGYGSAILTKAIREQELNKIPLYLETSSEANVKYYERKGFSLYHSIVLDSATSLTIYLMKLESKA
jgi:GNAT superfamily N-acetyltransferase